LLIPSAARPVPVWPTPGRCRGPEVGAVWFPFPPLSRDSHPLASTCVNSPELPPAAQLNDLCGGGGGGPKQAFGARRSDWDQATPDQTTLLFSRAATALDEFNR